MPDGRDDEPDEFALDDAFTGSIPDPGQPGGSFRAAGPRSDARGRLSPRTQTTEEDGQRANRCPNCQGEFDSWNTGILKTPACPFCGLERGEFDPSEQDHEKANQQIYYDRNLLAIGFALASDENAGWCNADDEDIAHPEEWAVVWTDLPEGQVTWHVPRELAETSSLEYQEFRFDGHSRDVKNRRLSRYIGGGLHD